MLPELKFVWFENMLTKRHDGRVWKPYIAQVFPNSPKVDHKDVRKRLKDACFTIRKCRNRIAHHEPIFHSPTLRNIYPLMSEAIEWRCQPTYKWLDDMETVTPLLNSPVL